MPLISLCISQYCQRMLQDYFSGVPEFPLAQCREILINQHGDVLSAVTGIRAIWQAFVDKWGYYGAHSLASIPTALFG